MQSRRGGGGGASSHVKIAAAHTNNAAHTQECHSVGRAVGGYGGIQFCDTQVGGGQRTLTTYN